MPDPQFWEFIGLCNKLIMISRNEIYTNKMYYSKRGSNRGSSEACRTVIVQPSKPKLYTCFITGFPDYML